MKKLILILCIIFMCSCNSPEEYKGIVINKDIKVKTETILMYNPVLKTSTPQLIIDRDYILIVKDSLNNENKYVVGKKYI